jgi:hypothetical protein
VMCGLGFAAIGAEFPFPSDRQMETLQ